MRIIGGQFRGRRLKAPKGRDTRPTPDRVRESLFQVLGDRVLDANVVELFGGTGSLGLESLSRGAAHVAFCETGRAARACLADNVRTLDVAEKVEIHHASAFSFPRIAATGPALDLVFCDPPFRMIGSATDRPRIENLLANVPLAPDGMIIVEHRAGQLNDLSPDGLALARIRRWGSTGMAFFEPA
jgi:16S rRNA (guanine966-N2)-methyltransferase